MTTTDDEVQTGSGAPSDGATSCSDAEILRSVRQIGHARQRTSPTAVAALALACFIAGASARDLTGYFARTEPVPFFMNEESRYRCGLLIDGDGTVLDEGFRPMGYYPGSYRMDVGPVDPWREANSGAKRP